MKAFVLFARAAAACALLLGVAANPSEAQTNDHLFRSWRWTPVTGGPRAAGLAGAFVAASGDASSVAINPAAMATLPRSELAASFYRASSGTVGVGDRRDSSSALGYVGGSGRLGPRLAIGGYLSQPYRSRLQLVAVALPDHAQYSGALEATVTEGGVAAAYNAAPRLHLGLRVTATHLELSGAYTRSGSSVLPDLESGAAAGHTRITGSFGFLYGDLDDSLRVGAAVNAGASYTVTRTANVPQVGGIDPGSEYEVRQPASVSAGAAYRLNPKMSFVGQVDFVRYSEIRPFLRPGTVDRGEYRAANGLEPAAGLEYSHPLGRWSAQLRAGIRSRAPGAIVYEGPNAAESAAFRAESRQTLAALGASLLQQSGVCLDVAAILGGVAPQFMGGARLRF